MPISTTAPIAIPAIAPAETLLDDDVCEATTPIAVSEASAPLIVLPYTVLREKAELLDDGV